MEKVVQDHRLHRSRDFKLLLLYYNASPHIVLKNRQKLQTLGIQDLPHLPYSPDLRSTDYHLFRSLQNRLAGQKFHDRKVVEKVIVIVIGFFCLASMYSNYIIINFTFICMKNDFSDAYVDGNGTTHSIYDYTSEEKKWIMWSVAFGTIIGTIPLNILYVKYGARYTFPIAGFISCIATAFVPWAAHFNFFILIILRFIQGFAYSADFAAIGLMCVRWAPLSETAIFVSILTSFNGIASTITNSATGLICESFLGWRYSYYFHAVAGVALFVLWAVVYVDDPQATERVSSRELDKIQRNKSEAHLDKNSKVPYVVKKQVSAHHWYTCCGEATPNQDIPVSELSRIRTISKGTSEAHNSLSF
uniref:MFS domain-containing protein n=1 Tax=Caenorhabditis japonica TaxID=281687 RepID=A0A8R1HXK6_CAEJA